MTTNKLLMAAAAIALMVGTGDAFAQQQPAHSTTGEKLAQKTMARTDRQDTNLTFDTTPDDHARLREIFGKDRSVRRVDHEVQLGGRYGCAALDSLCGASSNHS